MIYTHYNLEWQYEQKEGFHRAEHLSKETLIELLRFLSADDESNRTYVRVFAGSPPLFTRVSLEEAKNHLNNGYAWPYLVDGEKS